MDINNGYDRHLDPPDESEAEYCESCGQELDFLNKNDEDELGCTNPFCPDKHQSNLIVHDMSERLAEVEQELAAAERTLKFTQNALKYVRARLSNVQLIRERREKTIEELEQKIAELTQSQQGE